MTLRINLGDEVWHKGAKLGIAVEQGLQIYGNVIIEMPGPCACTHLFEAHLNTLQGQCLDCWDTKGSAKCKAFSEDNLKWLTSNR